jgi:hypothetical protein
MRLDGHAHHEEFRQQMGCFRQTVEAMNQSAALLRQEVGLINNIESDVVENENKRRRKNPITDYWSHGEERLYDCGIYGLMSI